MCGLIYRAHQLTGWSELSWERKKNKPKESKKLWSYTSILVINFCAFTILHSQRKTFSSRTFGSATATTTRRRYYECASCVLFFWVHSLRSSTLLLFSFLLHPCIYAMINFTRRTRTSSSSIVFFPFNFSFDFIGFGFYFLHYFYCIAGPKTL